jgi:hypothetical protein
MDRIFLHFIMAVSHDEPTGSGQAAILTNYGIDTYIHPPTSQRLPSSAPAFGAAQQDKATTLSPALRFFSRIFGPVWIFQAPFDAWN